MALLDFFHMKYPSTDFHELNLDWCITAVLQLQAAFEDFSAGNKLIFADPLQHDLASSYAKNTIVIDASGTAYLSLQPVPKGVQLSNALYWLPVFDFQGYVMRANMNFSDNYFVDTDRAPYALSVGDWVVLDDVLYKVTVAIPADGLFEVGTNIVHFTVEQFLKDFVTSVTQTINDWRIQMTGTINQYKNDIDASELAFTTNLTELFNQAVAGTTVDSEVLLARVAWDGETYSTLGEAIQTVTKENHEQIQNEFIDGVQIHIQERSCTLSVTIGQPIVITTPGPRAILSKVYCRYDTVLKSLNGESLRAFKVDNATDTVLADSGWVTETVLSTGYYYIALYNNISDDYDAYNSISLYYQDGINKFELPDQINDRVYKYYDVIDYTGNPTNYNTTTWFCFRDFTLKAGKSYKIKNGFAETGAKIALVDSTNTIVDLWSTSTNSEKTVTPSVDSKLIFVAIGYVSSTNKTAIIKANYNNDNIGDTLTFDNTWVRTTFMFAINIEAEYVPEQSNNRIVVIDKYGSGKYLDPKTAIDNEPSGTVFLIKPGEYDIPCIHAFKKRVVLIGTDREKCRIINTNGLYTDPVIECCCGYFANLTLYSKYVSGTSAELDQNTNGAYAVHCEYYDHNEDMADGDALQFDNCNLISDFFPAIGVGSFANWKLIINNCRITTNQPTNKGSYSADGGLGAIYMHDMNSTPGHADFIFHNTIFENTTSDHAIGIKDNNITGASMTIEAINSTVYSLGEGQSNQAIWWRNMAAWSNNTSKSPLANGNNISALNN